MKKIFVLPLLFWVQVAKSQLLNSPAPSLTFNHLLQSPLQKATAENFKGKTIVLEFWATWCTPCIANLPHLNEVQAHFSSDSSIVFVSVTDEPGEKVERFLQKRKMNGWVAADAKEILTAYGVQGLPHTFIIDKAGQVVYNGRPEALDTNLLAAVSKGHYLPAKTQEKAPATLLGGWSPGEDPVFTANFDTRGKLIPYQHTIRKSVMPESGGGYGWSEKPGGGVGVTILNTTIAQAMAILYSLPSANRVMDNSDHKDEKWDIIFSRNKGYDTDKAFMEIAQSLKTALTITAKDTILEIRTVTATLVSKARVINEAGIDFNDPATKGYQSIAMLLSSLEEKMNTAVVYDFDAETQYIDAFDITGAMYTMSAAELENWLKSKGLAFETGKRPVKLLWVD